MKPKVNRLMLRVQAERKKLGVLGALMLALCVVGVRGMLNKGPRSANAALGLEKEEASQRGANGAGDKAGRKPDIRTTLPVELTRDLFALDEEQFPRPSQTEPAVGDRPKSALPKVETSSRFGPDRKEDSPEERVAADLRKLRLKGTILGGSPMAVIEYAGAKDNRGTVVRPGESIEGFTLIEVVNAGVVLEKEGIRVELKRALPEG